MGARLYSPSHIVAIDLADSRLEAAKQFGADVVGEPEPTRTRSRSSRDLTDGLGADVAIEAVGTPETFELTVDAGATRAATSRTSVCTASRRRCTSRTSGSRT